MLIVRRVAILGLAALGVAGIANGLNGCARKEIRRNGFVARGVEAQLLSAASIVLGVMLVTWTCHLWSRRNHVD